MAGVLRAKRQARRTGVRDMKAPGEARVGERLSSLGIEDTRGCSP